MQSIKITKPGTPLADLEDMRWDNDKSSDAVSMKLAAHFLIALNYSVLPGLVVTALPGAWRRLHEALAR